MTPSAKSNTPEQDIEGVCAYSGHSWAPMGGGLYVCMLCDEEAWDIDPEELDG